VTFSPASASEGGNRRRETDGRRRRDELQMVALMSFMKGDISARHVSGGHDGGRPLCTVGADSLVSRRADAAAGECQPGAKFSEHLRKLAAPVSPDKPLLGAEVLDPSRVGTPCQGAPPGQLVEGSASGIGGRGTGRTRSSGGARNPASRIAPLICLQRQVVHRPPPRRPRFPSIIRLPMSFRPEEQAPACPTFNPPGVTHDDWMLGMLSR